MCTIMTLRSAFTAGPTLNVTNPSLVDDGTKCGSDSICYNQGCVSVSSLGLPQCPTGSNEEVCSGNGVRIDYIHRSNEVRKWTTV